MKTTPIGAAGGEVTGSCNNVHKDARILVDAVSSKVCRLVLKPSSNHST
ncbi:MAG TPA: hypothetical protein VFG14_09325 [Chthoniobacteraceae bacterium]|jgi:hypothetical protein|nr:hypothetical protein [Chthoniobacteraceae bacterium]